MSAATDDVPVFVLPEHVSRRAAMRLVVCDDAPAPVAPAARPAPSAQPLRLTRRGVAVLAAAVAVVAAALVGLAWLSAPSSAGSTPAPAVAGDTVAVAPGDSLWSIAGRVAPNRDPREEVALLQRLNDLDGSSGSVLVPGQVLRVH
jgi:Tfp pilus assembly protein FimV